MFLALSQVNEGPEGERLQRVGGPGVGDSQVPIHPSIQSPTLPSSLRSPVIHFFIHFYSD